jgi:large subunit ribosomal protein L30
MSEEIAVVLVRGIINVKPGVKTTLQRLRLKRKNNCVILSKTPQVMGMIQKVKDYVTWGEVTAETKALLVKIMKRKGGKVKVAQLQPPRKGFGRKGIKVPFTIGGALGNRDQKINELIQRMV